MIPMDSTVLIEFVKQAPALTILSVLVWYVMRTFEHQLAKSEDRFGELWKEVREEQAATRSAVTESTRAIATVLERISPPNTSVRRDGG
jgi:hypothetical protein